MSTGHIVVQGASCECQFGNAPDDLVVESQSKEFINDSDGSKKLVGNTMDIGMPFKAKTFGQCKLQPTPSGYLSCIPNIQQWEGFYDKIELDNGGNILTEKSKGTCAISGTPCVKFTWHGQTAQSNSSNVAQTDEETQSYLNPLVNIKQMDEVTEPEDLEASNDLDATKEPKPSIEKIGWLDDMDTTKIVSAEFGENIRVFIQVKDINLGETVTIHLYAKSGGNFEAQTTKEYTAQVAQRFGSTYAIFSIELDPNWGINSGAPQSNTIDTIYAKATYNEVNKDFSTKGLELVVQKLKGIYLKKGNDEAYYYKSKLYSATPDKKGMIPYTEKPRRQFRETIEALDTICSKPKGKKFIDDIVARSNPYFIEITRKKGLNKTNSKTVSWVPGDNHGGLDEHGNTKREPFISLVHELWHAWENWLKIEDTTIWISATKDYEKETMQELTASQFENEIRVEHKMPRRKWYAYTIDENNKKNGYGQIF
ncbi:PAAR-like protein [Aquimarina muelleri]|uniref:PAAR-like protein n=1 Tax=Aquimarina muelleri TaxID=279356 RepID=UPI003F683364